MRRKWAFWIPVGITGMLAFIAIGGLVVMQLWNWLLPDLFGWRELTFWQALGLLALSRILFGGLGFRGGSPRSRFRRRMEERWSAMTPEERERFQQGMRGRCGFGSSTTEAPGQSASL
ncbi:MAG TPA: hypothetical protein VGJ21_21770 [Terracidiphilus sp.]|jgi:hypothetical protein